MIRKSRKTRYKRGKEHHSGKHRRGAGNRGGRGRAGTGKKGSHKQSLMYARGEKLGHHGFTPHNKTVIKAINVGDLMKHVKGSSVDASELGYDKVLGGGQALKGVTVKAKVFTESAKEKIEKANGKAVVM